MPETRNEHIIRLAAELLDDIELNKLGPEALVLKASRLARLAGTEEIREWLSYELGGYSNTEVGRKYMTATRRWTDIEKMRACGALSPYKSPHF